MAKVAYLVDDRYLIGGGGGGGVDTRISVKTISYNVSMHAETVLK